jgi:hypothetical protein
MKESYQSAQPCGCDPGQCPPYRCRMHIGADMQRIEREKDLAVIEELAAVPITHTTNVLPAGAKERKEYPVTTGVLDYFPDAIAAIAHVSYIGNEQHNPGEKLHWARGKSTDQADALLRHLIARGTPDSDGLRHSAKMAWRALAILQLEIEGE